MHMYTHFFIIVDIVVSVVVVFHVRQFISIEQLSFYNLAGNPLLSWPFSNICIVNTHKSLHYSSLLNLPDQLFTTSPSSFLTIIMQLLVLFLPSKKLHQKQGSSHNVYRSRKSSPLCRIIHIKRFNSHVLDDDVVCTECTHHHQFVDDDEVYVLLKNLATKRVEV